MNFGTAFSVEILNYSIITKILPHYSQLKSHISPSSSLTPSAKPTWKWNIISVCSFVSQSDAESAQSNLGVPGDYSLHALPPVLYRYSTRTLHALLPVPARFYISFLERVIENMWKSGCLVSFKSVNYILHLSSFRRI